MAAVYNITIDQGATFSLDLQINDDAGDPIDLTTWTFRGQMRKTFNDSTIIESFTFTKANQGTDPGKVTVSLTDTETSAIAATAATTSYVYDIETVVGSVVRRIMQGKVYLSAEVTR